MAQDSMVLFAKNTDSSLNGMRCILKNGGLITPEMSVLGDEIKKVN
jgi:hypothetical protein